MSENYLFVLNTIYSTYPDLIGQDILKLGIYLCDDADGTPIYIEKWFYEKPIPEGLKIGK